VLALPLAAAAQDVTAPPRPERNPHRAHKAEPHAATLPGDAPTVPWSEGEVAPAKADCARLLVGLALDYEALAAIKEGMCGAPAPILVKSIGSDPKVKIDPPATVTCALAKSLGAWLDKTVQPEARTRFGVPVVKLANASSYVCRNRYGGANTPISEHALANALDISEFVLQSGARITVLDAWPRTVAAATPTEKPARVVPAEDVTGSIAKTAKPAKTIEAVNVSEPAATAARTNPFVVPAVPSVTARTNPFAVPAAATEEAPPKPPTKPMPQASGPVADNDGAFVRKVHDDACPLFGTVLGPEANEAHKSHFHLDMKARRHASICE
jgi:hypothetical protein